MNYAQRIDSLVDVFTESVFKNLVHHDDPEISLSRIQPCARSQQQVQHKSPICNIPLEILSEIFVQCCTFSVAMNHTHLIEPTALYLSQICSVWRNIVISMPKLWSMITIHGANVHKRPLPAKRLLCTYLAHAGQAPLNIRLVCASSIPGPEDDLFLDFLRTLLHQCEHRRVSLITDLKRSRITFIAAFNLLFTPHSSNIQSITLVPGLGLFILFYPDLSHLTVTRPTYWDMISLALASSARSISRLDFVDCSVADICSIGSVFPKLNHIVIQNPLRSASPDNAHIPLLVSLTITLPKPRLQPLNKIFETFSLPNLTSLTIYTPVLPIDTFIAFLEKSPALRTLTVSSCVSNFSLFIAASKNLAVLDIYAHEECLDEIFDVIERSRRPSEAIVLRMVEKKDDEDEDEVNVSCIEDKGFSGGNQDDNSAHVGSTTQEDHNDDDEESDSEDERDSNDDSEDETESSEESDDDEVDAAYKMARPEIIQGARLKYHNRMRRFRAAGRRIAIC
ncbi:uncharacterized protein EV420DRAFT_155713 [Desarmillaria tabescens]|uniref:F-box domain-containing protein n=1 Tax=Armillaria tabescens TaxID=1929756 RepID=A0AA39MLL2_ARMTA|nr:uncharacterized protein EV420DRAFT_155713 [Desarmillaria tabescens]KAK0437945.1 hypothetical protein EV420DRAFT_155713 [Desarmillaria tabescens]